MVLSVTALEYRSFAALMLCSFTKSKVPLHASIKMLPFHHRQHQIPAAVLKLIVSIFAALVFLLLLFRRPLQNQSNLVKYETDRQRVNQQIFSEIKQNQYVSLKLCTIWVQFQHSKAGFMVECRMVLWATLDATLFRREARSPGLMFVINGPSLLSR